MGEQLFLEERRRAILQTLEKEGRVSVKDLSDSLKVSAVTIRQDLRALEAEGYLERTYGGAVMRASAPSLPGLPELSFDVRRKRHEHEKEVIARRAAEHVRDGYGVALDASTTAFAVTPFLKRFDGLTIVTNSLIIAQQFLDTPRIQVLFPAGRLRRDSISVVGSPASLPSINLNVGFFGARGLSLHAGLCDISADEAEMKRALMAHCVESYVVIDGSKWGNVAPYTYATSREITGIITSSRAPLEQVEQFRTAGVRVDVVTIK